MKVVVLLGLFCATLLCGAAATNLRRKRSLLAEEHHGNGTGSHFSIVNGIRIHEVRSISTMHASIARKSLPLCRGNEHTKGRWIRDEEVKHKDFVCCGWDGNDFEFNKTSCGHTRYGRDMPYFFGSNFHYTHAGGNACSRDRSNGTRLTPHEQEKWIWEPESCRLLPWDGKHFCELLGKRRMLFVGDSTMEQHIATIASMVRDHQGGCAQQLMYTRNELMKSSSGFMALTDILETTEPDLLIVNSGPHVHAISEMETVVKYLEDNLFGALERVALTSSVKTKVIIRGQHPGHENCTSYTQPLKTFTIPTTHDRYDWYLHRNFDTMFETFVSKHNHPQISYWDTWPLYLRPEAHIWSEDCLHFSLPGPLNFESNLLLTKLFTKEL